MRVRLEMKHGRSWCARIAGAGLYVVCEAPTVPAGFVVLRHREPGGLIVSAKPVATYEEGAGVVDRVLCELG